MFSPYLQHMLHTILKTLWPTQCLLCRVTTPGKALCQPCLQTLPWNTTYCYRCGLSLHQPILCGACVTRPPTFDKTIALFRYEAPITQFITQLKFNKQLLYANLLGKLLRNYLLEKHCQDSLPDCIIPVPLHRIRLRQRGFNQALEIAKPISKKLKVPLALDLCQRIKNTQPQTELPATKRAQNIKNAFAMQSALSAKHIAIVDDVVTTGNTIRELSHLLQKNGAEKIEIWCCARAMTRNTIRPLLLL